MGKGKLVFKGEKKKRKKKKHVSKHSIGSTKGNRGGDDMMNNLQTSTTTETKTTTSDVQLPQVDTSNSVQQIDSVTQQQVAMPVIQQGSGKITSSGTILMGHNANFTSILNSGDAITVMVPTSSKGGGGGSNSCREEMRVITMRVSDNSAAISTAFSQDLKKPVEYKYICKPRNKQLERLEKQKKENLSKEETERCAFGIYNSNGKNAQEFVYRERTENGSYRIKREAVSSNGINRSDLLEMRAKKKSDRYC